MTVDKDKNKIEVVEEQLTVQKHMVTTGSLHVTKKVEELIQSVTVPLSSESFTIERIPKDHFIETAPEPLRNEPGRIVISVVEERLVIEKRLFLVEEIHLIRTNDTSVYHEEFKLKKEVVDVERKPASDK